MSVYQEIYAQLPNVQYIYAFDDAAFPYGELPEDELIARTRHIVSLLVERHAIDLVVVAVIQQALLFCQHCGMCYLFRSLVLSLLLNLRLPASKVIGLLATPATVQREYTELLISQFASHCQVLRIGSTRLVEMAEQKLRGQAISLTELEAILKPWRNVVDCIVLGCTHFPLIRDEITQALAGEVTIVDSGRAIANRVVICWGSSGNQ